MKGVLVSLLAVLLAGTYFFIGIGQLSFSDQQQPLLTASLEASASNIMVPKPNTNISYPIRNWAVADLEIPAPAAISVKISDDGPMVLFSKNATQKLPVASLTKLMTALVVLEHYDLNKKIVITDTAMAQEGEQGSLKAGETLSVKDLLYISLIESSNRAAYALTEEFGSLYFIDVMNATAERLGLANTHFVDSTGLSEHSYSTAEDVVKLSAYLLKYYPLFGQIISLKEYDLHLPNGKLHHTLINTNKLLGVISQMLGGKTGWTSQAKGCFMAVEQGPVADSQIVSVVLGSNDRFLEIKNIIEWAHTAYQWQ